MMGKLNGYQVRAMDYPKKLFCSECGADINIDANVCGQCGTKAKEERILMKVIYSKETALKEIQESPKEAKKHNLKANLIITGCCVLFASMILFLTASTGFLFHSPETGRVVGIMCLCIFFLWIFLVTHFKESPEDLYSFPTDYYLIIKDKKLLNTGLQQISENEYSLKVTVANSEGLVTVHFIKGLTRRTKLGIDEHIVDLEKGVVYTPYTID